MAESVIRWRKSDYAKLGRAVANFNRKIKSAERDNFKNIDFLPELKKYKNVKDSIQTRREFNRVINSLKRINKADALDLIFTRGGEPISMWEFTEVKRQAKMRLRSLNKEIEQFKSEKTNSELMGLERIGEITKEIENIKKLEEKKGYEFKKIMNSIQKKGTSDYEFKMKIIFRTNYLEALKDFENEPFYNKLIKKIKNLNPNDFYDMMKKNNLIDFLSADWYRLDRNKYSNLLRNLDIADIPDYNYGSYEE